MNVFVNISEEECGSTKVAPANWVGRVNAKLFVPAAGGKVKPGHAWTVDARWPHYGPGNSSTSEERTILFLSFPMNDEARSHNTSEKVIWPQH